MEKLKVFNVEMNKMEETVNEWLELNDGKIAIKKRKSAVYNTEKHKHDSSTTKTNKVLVTIWYIETVI